LYTCKAEGPFELDPQEISEGKWLSPGALEDWMQSHPREFSWSFVYLWEKYTQQAAAGSGRRRYFLRGNALSLARRCEIRTLSFNVWQYQHITPSLGGHRLRDG
jgi:hypothetical protein